MGAGAAVDASVIHFSATFHVSSTPCGKLGPAAGRWGFVTCLGCLRAGPRDPRIGARIVTLGATANDVASMPPAANDIPARAPGLAPEALEAYLAKCNEERARLGAELLLNMPKRRRR
jgi:hypothetical protein